MFDFNSEDLVVVVDVDVFFEKVSSLGRVIVMLFFEE